MTERNYCPCCALYMHDAPQGCDDVCPICMWGDNSDQRENPDRVGVANEASLNQARIRFSKGIDAMGNQIVVCIQSSGSTMLTASALLSAQKLAASGC